ncbi:MAG: flavin reductase family protein [Arcicella sp.]|jgi:flavin reductase (DIM6/NTAB) family NADH-FMN oxidoreductase RutF|nr:flavin reductase family protein [Arcicella sp.]
MTFDLKQTDPRLFYTIATASIAPRPIAFASTIDKNGNVNLSPFSFFNFMGIDPPILVFSPNKRGRDGSQKHTTENLHEVPEVVINLVDFSMVQQMSLSSCEFPKGVNEFVKAGFTAEKSQLIQPPRVKESPVQFECKVLEIKAYGTANLIICEVLMAHINDDLLNQDGKIDQLKTDWVARLGGDWYARITPDSLFEVSKPNQKQGIGIDQIPDFIKNSDVLTGNELGKLGNIEKLPTREEIKNYFTDNQLVNSENKILLAQELLLQNQVFEAWCVLLSNQ